MFRCRKCGYSAQTELDGCPACGADWKAIDVSHGPGCPKNRLDEAMDSPNGALVRRCFRILNAKSIGLTITLADITEEEFRVLELIEAERQEQIKTGHGGVRSLRITRVQVPYLASNALPQPRQRRSLQKLAPRTHPMIVKTLRVRLRPVASLICNFLRVAPVSNVISIGCRCFRCDGGSHDRWRA